MFMGTYYNSIDAKNRIIVPSKHRDQLGGRCVVTKGLDKCLYIYSIAEWEKQMDKIAEQRGVPLAQIALNWSTQRDFVDTAICGVSKPAQALENCAAANWTLTDEEMAFLNDAVEQYA